MALKKTTTPMTNAQLKALIAKGVADVLVEIKANRRRNDGDSHDSRTGIRRQMHVARDLKRWNLFSISATAQLHVKSSLQHKTLMKMLTDKYCPRGEIKKLEIEIWNLKVKGTDVTSYTQPFQELALMCGRMFPEESDQVKKYVGGFPDMIQGSVMASKPKTMQDAIEFTTELMDQKIHTFAERQAENKRKLDNNNQAQRQPPKRQNVARAYSAGSSEKKEYARTLPLCNK
ncbi:hypothetical protein Tco_1027029 [Tanacetum coccineum]